MDGYDIFNEAQQRATLASEYSPNFPNAQYLDIRTAEALTNCFISSLKRPIQQIT